MNRAPTLNRAAIGPQAAPGPVPGPGSGPASAEDPEEAKRKRDERERVAVAVEFGAVLEDLVGYVHLVAYPRPQWDEADVMPREPDAAQRTSLPRFPPDLLVQLTPKAHLQRALQKLRKLEPSLLRSEQAGATERQAPPERIQQQERARQQAQQARQQPGTDEPEAGGTNHDGPQQMSSDDGQQSRLGGTEQQAQQQEEESEEPEQRERQPGPERRWEGPPRPDGIEEQAQQEQARQVLSRTEHLPEPEGTGQAPPRSEGIPQQAQQHRQQPSGPGGMRQQPRQLGLDGRPSQPGFSKAFAKIEQCINDLLPAHDGQGGSREHELPLSSLDGLYDAICRWNDSIVEQLVDSPAVLSGYRVGKALSFTRWQIRRVDEHWDLADGLSPADSWNEAFGKQRIDEIQRHANVLGSVLDPRAVAAVVTGLGYWRSSLLYLTLPSRSWPWSLWRDARRRLASLGEPASARSRQPSSRKEQTIKVSRGDREELIKALEEQVENWLDVLTGQRPPESFPVAGIVASLTKKVAANLWAKLFRYLLPFLIVLVVAGALVTGFFVIRGDPEVWSRLLGGLGTALIAVFTALFAPRGQSLLGRGGAAGGPANGVAGIQAGPVAAGGYAGPRGGVALRDNFGVGRAIVSGAASLKQDAFSEVVEQLRLEELNLAVSDPLVRCVLALRGQEKGDPKKDAERFLQLVYKNESNLKRLRPVFKDLYKY